MLFGSPGSWWLAKVKQPEPRRDSVPFVGCLGECDSHSCDLWSGPYPSSPQAFRNPPPFFEAS